ncbi:MAG: hydrogenase maturation nickel metallochaperone HypA [Thermodesulfovibrionales bacterium]
MHEVGITQGILDIAIENCKKRGYTGIESIKVKIGKAAGVMPDSLLFAFEAMKVGTIAEKAVLIIDEIPVSGYCNGCSSDFSVDDAYVITCPKCGHLSLRIDTGRELNIDEMEVF